MSLVDGNVDLGALSRSSEGVEPPRRSWLRIVVPLAILSVFGWVLRDSLAELWRERPTVTVVRPVRLEGQPVGSSGVSAPREGRRQLAVQAAGWVEPDPFPVFVPALGGGVVLDVLVEDSDVVAVGDVVAKLVADDARLAHDEAAARVEALRASLELARVRKTVAAESFEAAIGVTEAAATASADRAGLEAEAEHRAASLREGEALVSLAESELIVQEELDAAGASGARQVEIAEAELEVARARLATLTAQLERAKSAALGAKAREERAQADLRTRFADRLERDSSAAAVKLAEAELARAEAELATAALALERTEVVSGSAGVVLERIAVAGETLAPGAPVCSLFTPEKLRVRVDVPQGDIEKVRVGQSAEVLADARPGRPYRGEVIRIVERADIQKVTLEAQVRVLDSDGLLRPDMLTQVRFFSDGEAQDSGRADGEGSDAVALRLAIPDRVIEGGAAWLFDPVAGEARRAVLELGSEVSPGKPTSGVWREVLGGVNLTDKVIDGGRVELERMRADQGGVDRLPVRIAEETP